MTIFNFEEILSRAQAIVATVVSTNVIDLGLSGTPFGGVAPLNRDVGKGRPCPILIQIVEAFNNLTSLQIDLEVDDNVGFSSAKVVDTQVILLADLVAGKQTFMQFLPNGVDEQFVRVNYTVVGAAPTLGKVTAGITMGNQTNP